MSVRRFNITLTEEERKLLDQALNKPKLLDGWGRVRFSRSAIIGWLIRKEFGKKRGELA